jgi:PAS domain S-box-containing protein
VKSGEVRYRRQSMPDDDSLLRDLLDLAPVGVVVWGLADRADDRSLTLRYANDRATEYVGAELRGKLGRRLVDIFPSVEPARLALYAEAIRHRRGFDELLRSVMTDQGDTLRVRAVPRGDDALVVYFEDLAVKQLTEAAERISLDQVIEHLPLMVFVKDAKELKFVRVNRQGEELLGLSREQLVGKTDHDFFPKEQADAFVAADRDTLERTTPLDVPEEPIRTASGERWLHTRKVPIRDADGAPRYLLGISLDITESRRAAERVRAARDAAENANRELEAFSYSVAHDLRAPLRAIAGFSATLLEDYAGGLDEKAREYLARSRNAAAAMGNLIDDLLELSRLSRVEVRRERVDVSAKVRSVVGQLLAAQPGRDVELVVADGLVANADRALLRILLTNLLANAVKFTSKNARARIEVGSRVENGRTVLFVKDDGAGFDMRYASKLFAPFERLHSAHEFPGTGVGLAIVQRIVARHGGTIRAESEPGKGAIFLFSLGEPAPSATRV